MTKKKIIAIILFLFLSLFMFTFANPGDIEPELKKPEKTKQETKKEEVKEDTEEKQETTQTVINQNTNNSANNNSSNETNKKHLDAPVIKVPEGSLVILLGESYDVMEGVKVISEENLTATADITDTSKLLEGKHTITYTVTDSEGNSATATREVVVLDPNKDEDKDGFSNGEEIIDGTDPLDENDYNKDSLKAPEITLLGSNPYVMLQGETYEEAGVKIELDEHDTETTVEDVETTGEVNTQVVGDYTLKYTITDKYEKSASVERTVKVLDPTADEDDDGFTNEEEINDGTNPLDKTDHGNTKAPEITLLGSNPYVMLQGETYEEAGVKIELDEHDTETTIEDVETTGEVNAQVVGDYTLKYTITDKYEKSASVERTVKVLAPDADEDGDGFTNEEEINDGTDPLDKTDHGNTKAPKITLLGSNPYVMLQGETYEEAGVKIELDEHDTATTIEDVETTGEVNAQIVGDYTLKYTITDKYEKSASVERTIKVLALDADEDGDRYSNIDEINNGFDPLDDQSHPAVPTLTLHGQNPYPMLQNQENDYVEAGYNYTVDPTSSESTVVVKGTDSINKSVVGNYEINYSLTDKYGVNVSKVRTVKVLAPDADEDGDRINNGEEFKDGTDPLDPNSCKYTVTFYGYNNTLLKTEKVNKGQSANAPILADDKISINGFEFKGWNPNEFVNIQSNLDVYAIYVDVEKPTIELSQSNPDANGVTITAKITDNDELVLVKYLSGEYRTPEEFPSNKGTTLTSSTDAYSFNVSENDYYTVYAEDKSGNVHVSTIKVESLSTPEEKDDFNDEFLSVTFGSQSWESLVKRSRSVTATAKKGVTIKNARIYVADNGLIIFGGWFTDYVPKSAFESDPEFGTDITDNLNGNYKVVGKAEARITLYIEFEYNGNTYSRVYRTRVYSF